MHFHGKNHVAEALYEIVAVDLRRRDHEVAAFGHLQIEIVGAAVVVALRPLLAVTGELTLVDDRIDQPVIVDVLTDDVSVREFRLGALLLKMLLLVDFRVGDQRLLGKGRNGDHEESDKVQGDQERFHGFLFWSDKDAIGQARCLTRLAPPLPP
jgi:hypothetical protein